MSEPITKQLRGLMNHTQLHGVPLVELGEFEFRLRCDEIDAIVEALEAENRRLADSIRISLTQADEPPRAAESHDGWVEWVELPRDADGVPWHIGDRTESGQTIEAMGLNRYGWHFVGTVNEIDPAIHRHCHTLTVKDVLREFADGIEGQNDEFRELALEDYAKRLRLAGEDA